MGFRLNRSFLFSPVGIVTLSVVALLVLGGLVLVPRLLSGVFDQPVVVSTTPEDGEVEAALSGVITFRFDSVVKLNTDKIAFSKERPLTANYIAEANELEIVPEQKLSPGVEYKIEVPYKNSWGFQESVYTLTFTTRPVTALLSVAPAEHLLESDTAPPLEKSSLFERLEFVFQYPLVGDYLDYEVSPDGRGQFEIIGTSLLLSPTEYWESNQKYQIVVSPSDNAPEEERFTPFTYYFWTTEETREQVLYEEEKQEEEQRQEEIVQEQTEIQTQYEADRDFSRLIESTLSSDPRLDIINNQLPYETSRFKINYLAASDAFVVGYRDDAAREEALRWFSERGYEPDNLLWVQMRP